MTLPKSRTAISTVTIMVVVVVMVLPVAIVITRRSKVIFATPAARAVHMRSITEIAAATAAVAEKICHPRRRRRCQHRYKPPPPPPRRLLLVGLGARSTVPRDSDSHRPRLFTKPPSTWAPTAIFMLLLLLLVVVPILIAVVRRQLEQ